MQNRMIKMRRGKAGYEAKLDHGIILCLSTAPTSPPLNISVTVQSSRSLYVTWELPSSEDRNGMITRYILNVTSVPDGDTIQLTSNTTQFTYDSLQPYTTYTIAIAAETNAGIGPFSQAATLTTPEDGIYSIEIMLLTMMLL